MQQKVTGLLATLAFAAPALAQQNPVDEPLVVVTANRFAEADPRIPANISVITREDIRNSPAKDLPGVLKSRAGIDVRALYGSLGVDSVIDLRGFGDAAGSNVLILLDGQRMNAVDASGISWSAIPLDGVQRIEIVRGAGTVLYGDRASAGVINIITDKSGKARASATATIGSNDTRALDVQAAGGNERFYGNVFAHYANTEGWRQNSAAEQSSLSGRVGATLGSGEVFANYALYADRSGLPGYLASADYAARPRYSRTPNDSQERNGYRLRPGVSFPLGETLRFDAEASLEHEDMHSNYVSFASVGDRSRDTWSLTPRLNWKHGLGSLASETVIGADLYIGEVDARYSTSPAQGARQTSTSAYLQNRTGSGPWTLTLGARRQRMEQSVHQSAYAPWFSPAVRGESARERTAWDAGLSYAADQWRVYGKVGTTYRFANTDELFGYDPMTGNTVFAGDLRPQHGTIREVGGSVDAGPVSARVSVYRLDLTDEIGYDGNAFANVNFDPTRRQGFEAEIDWRLTSQLRARLSYAYVDASFRSGAYRDKRLPLVPRDKGSLQLLWDGGQWGKYTALVNAVGDRRYSGDFFNTRKRLAGYTTVDLHAAWDLKPWLVSVRLLNAFDKRYSPFAGYSPFISDYYYYPADGRSLFVSAKYEWK
ncbi:MAG: TonB-dependent receptor family protein [Betaproteobacteria bacterium]